MSLHIYSFFHLNIAYSAIEEEDRPRVIEKCYWPLLKLASNKNLKLGIELSGYTLEVISLIDPTWVKELRRLILQGSCELIGCGYAQIIGPLVPSSLITKNLNIGNKVYRKILGTRPKIALLNEQAFSKGLVQLYKTAGYKAIIMEWDNPYSDNINWTKEIGYLPQRAMGNDDNEIGLIWNNSIGFQKFQRYAHGELELYDLLKHVRSHKNKNNRAYSIYGNDIEIFDFRPGRYMTEANIHKDGEWKRICLFYNALLKEKDMKFIKPSEVLNIKNKKNANQILDLTSAAKPIQVKKQDKYNITRWAVTGRDDFKINTICWQIFDFLKKKPGLNKKEWKELCYLWSSDFRTHITNKRWKKYNNRINIFLKKYQIRKANYKKISNLKKKINFIKKPFFDLEFKGNFIEIKNKRFKIKFNCNKGLALESFSDNLISKKPIFGTIEHGYFDNIKYSADFYSGHLVFESPGKHKITDLSYVKPKITKIENGLQISCKIKTLIGPIIKKWEINIFNGKLKLSYLLDWKKPTQGSLRLGYITLLPKVFNKKKLYYETHNGGKRIENFKISDKINFDHSQKVSSLVSANQAISASEGIIKIGDNDKKINLKFDKSQASLIGLVSNFNIQKKMFTRLALSLREIDDTSKPSHIGKVHINLDIFVQKNYNNTAGQ